MDSWFWCGFQEKNLNVSLLLEVNLHEHLKSLFPDHYHFNRSHQYCSFHRVTFDCTSNFRLYTFLVQFQLFTQTFSSNSSLCTYALIQVCLVIRGSEENQLLKKTSLSSQLSTSVMQSTDRAQKFCDTFLCHIQHHSMDQWSRGNRLQSIIQKFCIQSECSLFRSFACCYSSQCMV